MRSKWNGPSAWFVITVHFSFNSIYRISSIRYLGVNQQILCCVPIGHRNLAFVLFNPHSTEIFYHLIIPCGVQLDPRQRFTICTYQNETDCLHLLYISNLTLFTWHIIWMRIRKVPLQHPWATFLSYKQKMKWPSEPNEQDIQYPITSLIFVIESQTVSLPMFSGSRKPVFTFNS